MLTKQFLRIDSSILRPLIALVVMSVALAFASESFATADNLFNVMRQVSVNLGAPWWWYPRRCPKLWPCRIAS